MKSDDDMQLNVSGERTCAKLGYVGQFESAHVSAHIDRALLLDNRNEKIYAKTNKCTLFFAFFFDSVDEIFNFDFLKANISQSVRKIQ